MKITIAKSVIELRQGDITALKVDAIVNAANNHFWMGSGVAGAIRRKGGDVIEKEAVAQGPVPVGEAVITAGGALLAPHVIHAAAMGQDLQTDEEKVRCATRNSFRRMEENNLVSIALPALGTGVGGLSLPFAAQGMIDEAIVFLENGKAPRIVIFVMFDNKAYNVFKGALEKRFPEG